MGASLGSGSLTPSGAMLERFFDPDEVAIGRGGLGGIKLQKKCDAKDFVMLLTLIEHDQHY